MTTHEIHSGIALALNDLGIQAKAYPRSPRTRENVVIRFKRNGQVYIYTAFVDGTILALGDSSLAMYTMFNLEDPELFKKVSDYLTELTETVDIYGFRDERFEIGDMLENHIKHCDNFGQ